MSIYGRLKWGSDEKSSLGTRFSRHWYLWSGINQPLIIGFGVFSVGFVLWMMKRMDDVAPDEPPYTLGLRPVAYLPYIIWEIIKANLDVTKAVLNPKTISPRTFK